MLHNVQNVENTFSVQQDLSHCAIFRKIMTIKVDNVCVSVLKMRRMFRKNLSIEGLHLIIFSDVSGSSSNSHKCTHNCCISF